MDKFTSYFERLEELSNEQLGRSTEKLVRTEKQNVALVVAHIAEIARRKADLELGYKSLFDYCLRRLHLSEGSIARRLQVANVSRRFPQLLVCLSENRISLTVAGMLAPHLSEANVDQLLSDCEGMSKRAAEEYLVALQPKPVYAPSIRRAPRRRAADDARVALAPVVRDEARSDRVSAAGQPRTRPVLEPARPAVFNFRFTADRDFKEKFERFAEVVGVANAQTHMVELIGQALDIALDKKDPKRKRRRRLKRKAKRPVAETQPCPGKVPEKFEESEGPARSRYIASEVRERVHARARYQCEFRGPDGTRCLSRTGLQIEHTRPFALFRSHDERFLKLLCRRHNALAAERVFGAAFIRDKIEERRQSGPASRG